MQNNISLMLSILSWIAYKPKKGGAKTPSLGCNVLGFQLGIPFEPSIPVEAIRHLCAEPEKVTWFNNVFKSSPNVYYRDTELPPPTKKLKPKGLILRVLVILGIPFHQVGAGTTGRLYVITIDNMFFFLLSMINFYAWRMEYRTPLLSAGIDVEKMLLFQEGWTAEDKLLAMGVFVDHN